VTLLFVQALLAGLIVAIPIGPVPLLCVQRTLLRSRRAGVASSLGGTVAHAVCGAVAALGIASLESWLSAHRIVLVLVGGVVLTAVGVLQWRAQRNAGGARPAPRGGLWGDAFSIFTLTAANPGTVISFGAAFAALGIFVDPSSPGELLAVTAGLLTGATVWWSALVLGAERLRQRLQPAALCRVQRATGGALTVLGIAAASTTLF
jgi:threonine/homoserine/homoserine lactone efflux protein